MRPAEVNRTQKRWIQPTGHQSEKNMQTHDRNQCCPPERARAEAGGADQWVLKRRDLPGFAIVDEKKSPHPWDTHYQFSIKTLLSNQYWRVCGEFIVEGYWCLRKWPGVQRSPGIGGAKCG